MTDCKIERLEIGIKCVKQELRNLRREYVVIERANDKPYKRQVHLNNRLAKLETELQLEKEKRNERF